MICVNELSALKCNNREVLTDLLIILSPFAPHISEELWQLTGNEPSISNAVFPRFNEDFIAEDSIVYPISFNGKMRVKLNIPSNYSREEIEKAVLADEGVRKYLKNEEPKKIIVVPNKIVNIVM
jgi:leucyl-tRNA synthetase